MSKKNENEHIPQYIKAQPWYYKDSNKDDVDKESEDYLKHHRQHYSENTLNINDNEEPEIGQGINDVYEEVIDDGQPKLKRRKDDRKNWDARNDRWYGYEGKEYDEVLKSWQEKQKLTEKEEEDIHYDTDEEIELRKLGLTRKDLQQTIKGSSVRLREDKAAYLKDIRSETINYDPKSRLYKSEDLGTIDEHSNMFLRHVTGEGKEMTELNRFARENAKKQGIRDELQDQEKVNHVLVANPTKLEQLKKNEDQLIQEKLKEQKKQEQKTKQKLKKMAKKKAKKSKGTPQSQETKNKLMDMYG